jgi:hypothetical protein
VVEGRLAEDEDEEERTMCGELACATACRKRD